MPFVTEGYLNLFNVQEGFDGRPEDPERKWSVPTYQRSRVWSDHQASLFVGSMITGASGLCTPCWINRNLYKDLMEIVDGQQRLSSLYRWMLGELHAIDPVTCDEIWVSDFTEIDVRKLYHKTWIRVMYVDLTLPEQLKLYLRLNTGGTPHTESEIQKVRDMLAEEVDKSK
jgi:uncharacterized protein with ParB-like and HNH nuclease domain